MLLDLGADPAADKVKREWELGNVAFNTQFRAIFEKAGPNIVFRTTLIASSA
jgi:hypothetical protein